MSIEITKEYDAFISYKSEDFKEAFFIKEVLSAKRIKCWFDKTNILVGKDYDEVIAKTMPLCRSLVLLLSDASQKSDEVKKEFEAARNNNLYIFPVRIYENVKLNDYYTENLKHIQIANDYFKNNDCKSNILADIRNQIFELRNEKHKTDKELFDDEVNILKDRLNQIRDNMESEFEKTIIKAVERCGFMTPEPHYMGKILLEYISDYQFEIDLLIRCIIHDGDLQSMYDFCDYINGNNPVVNMWIEYNRFVEIIHKGLTYLNRDDSDHATSFKLRMYKDYLYVLKSESFKHPIIKLLERLFIDKNTDYDKVVQYLKDCYQSSFIKDQCLAVYLDLLYFGSDYVNNGSIVKINRDNEVFSPHDIRKANDSDFVLKYLCDKFIEEVVSGNYNLINSYLSENTIINLNGEINALYLYMICAFSQNNHHDIVKRILRHMGKFDFIEYVSDDNLNIKDKNDYKAVFLAKDKHVKSEIAKMKKLFFASMLNSGYELKEAKKLWEDA